MMTQLIIYFATMDEEYSICSSNPKKVRVHTNTYHAQSTTTAKNTLGMRLWCEKKSWNIFKLKCLSIFKEIPLKVVFVLFLSFEGVCFVNNIVHLKLKYCSSNVHLFVHL